MFAPIAKKYKLGLQFFFKCPYITTLFFFRVVDARKSGDKMMSRGNP